VNLVLLEIGRKRVFASALAWPGWSRSGRTEPEALEALAACLQRYCDVVRPAGLPEPDAGDLVVAERLPGDMTTDFGAPGAIADAERDPLAAGEAERLAAIVRACWTYLDEVTATSGPHLRKGPRGGGRDRDPMVDHVIAAEAAYARKIGVRHKPAAREDPAAVTALRHEIACVLSAGGAEPQTPWPRPYAARRIAWHVLDHAWEMQDRALPG
jgi:hypothetical protein